MTEVGYASDKPSDCAYCYFFSAGRKKCKRKECFYRISSPPLRRGIAQLVEQWSPKPRAEGSNPSAPANFSYRRMSVYAAMAQVVERVLGKDEVTSSNLVSSSTITVLFV